jgi:hypothetical protein
MRRLTCFGVACVVFRCVDVHATQAAKGWVVRQLLLLDWGVLRSSSRRADYMYVYAWYFVSRRPVCEWWRSWYLQWSEG